MKTKEKASWLLLFTALGAFWRRWFGGGFGKLGDITRLWKYLVLVLIVFTMYWSLNILDWTSVRMYLVCLSFCYHWARSHHDWFYVWHTNPDQGCIKWIDWVLRHIFPESMYYGFWWNVTGLFLRYTSTALLVAICIPNALFITAGLLTTLAYVVTSKIGAGKTPVQCAEWLAGALNFGLLYISLCL